MASTPNNMENVSIGKGVEGGVMFVAPKGTELPTDQTTALDAAFLNMGYIGEDGISFADSADVTTFPDMNGKTIATSTGSIEKTFTVVFTEIKKDTLGVIYGTGNVTDADGTITVHDKGFNDEEYAVVLELLLKDGRKWRRVGESCKLGELGDMSINYSELASREVTMNVLYGDTIGDYWLDFIDSTETEKAEG